MAVVACGTPLVCFYAASLPEVVSDAAILVDPSDVVQIADRGQKSEDRGQKPALAIMGVLLAVVLLALGGRVWLGWLGRFLVASDPLRPVDALVVLGGGGRHRIHEGARLALAGVAPWLVVTNTRVSWPGVRASYAELMAQEAQWQGVPAQRILHAPGLVTTTVEEAHAVRALAAARGWRSLLVVTDPWHTRRARMIFRRVLRGAGVAVCAHPAPKPGHATAAWWTTADGVRDTWTEYQKLALYLVGHR